jgi:hypothetical protein
MIFLEMQLSGNVVCYEMSDRLLMLKVSLETRAECLPVPTTTDEALNYLSSTCWNLEIFNDYDEAEDWADVYTGFRADEVRAELRRFYSRKAAMTARDTIAA